MWQARYFRQSCAVVFLFVAAAPAWSAEPIVDYATQVKPLLSAKCYSCHGVLKQESDLRLETRALILAGGDSGMVIVPGDAADSLLIQRVSAEEGERMPPAAEGAALKPDEIALLAAWINQGANAPVEEVPVDPLEHWSFQSVSRPPLPPGSLEGANPIDAFLDAKRKESGVRAQPLAPRSLLIRRVYLDLVGLPPSKEQLHDPRPWSEIVDELLASPHHGERWGRHWMDVWRYSDWYGLGAQLRYSQKHIWRWRDWIIASLNADKGYDRMIQEMLAGDELEPTNPDVIAATGFLARNYYLFNRTTWLDSTIEHTGKAFLGLTINCAKCHDHKYDPISHEDYYRFRAIFEPHQVRLDPVPGVTDFEQDGLPRVFDDHLDAKTLLHLRGDPKNPDESLKIHPAVPEIFSSFQPEVEPVVLPTEAWAPATREYVQRDHLQAAEQALAAARHELRQAEELLLTLEKQAAESADDASAFVLEDSFDKPRPDVWELVGDAWEYRDGKLCFTQSTREPQKAQLRQTPPRDFVLRCRYTTTGGSTYKSVTFRFDLHDDDRYHNYVYTSAHEPGPKVQVAYARDGISTYPAEGRVGKPIQVGQSYELRFAVRDRLVNVWLDDEFLLAYTLPDRRAGGALSLSGFDATVAFDELSVRALPPDLELTPATNSAPQTPQSAQAAAKIVVLKVAAAEAAAEAIRAVLAAETAAHTGMADAETCETLAAVAARKQAESEVAAAQHAVLANQADAGKSKAAADQLKQAQAKLKKVEQGSVAYTPIRAAKKALESPAHTENDYPTTYSPTSTGRRLALARWMTSRQNPLTARVAVNHVWLRHFGQPLSESVFDFGLRAKRPPHADLLDYLAAEFMDSGWSFRHLHRLIVTSQAYQLSSSQAGADPSAAETDPGNLLYWRMNPRRMESQIVRDSLLHLAGELQLQLGGPSVDPIPASRRRSLYFKHSRDDQSQFLAMFDDADLLQCYRRSESIVPQQALALANSKLSLEMAGRIAARLQPSSVDATDSAFIQAAFESLLGRQPTQEEQDSCQEYYDEMAGLLGEDGHDDVTMRIRSRLVHVLLNHNDFITIR